MGGCVSGKSHIVTFDKIKNAAKRLLDSVYII
jgi:hypothetical protein